MKQSQYTDDYLTLNNSLGVRNGLTVGTFLSRQLRGKAKDYKGRYETALINSLQRRANVFSAKSAGDKIAYYSKRS